MEKTFDQQFPGASEAMQDMRDALLGTLNGEPGLLATVRQCNESLARLEKLIHGFDTRMGKVEKSVNHAKWYGAGLLAGLAGIEWMKTK